MSKKQKITIVAVFVAIVLVIGIIAGVLNHRTAQEGTKKITIEVISERDEYSMTTERSTDAESLGEFLRTFEECEWSESDYGIYILGFDGMLEDIDNQYWWCVSVNGESSMYGADEVLLNDGDVYNFTLMQGW